MGIDLGTKKHLTLSDNTIYDNNKHIEKYEKRIKRLQRKLSRKEKGSNNYYKCKKKLNILYTKVKNARKYNLHHITKEITDATLSEIIRQLKYKAKEKGKYFYQVSTYYPSIQFCSVCDNKDIKYKDLKERTYSCKKCHTVLDRDLNASINIMFGGLKMYMKEVYA